AVCAGAAAGRADARRDRPGRDGATGARARAPRVRAGSRADGGGGGGRPAAEPAAVSAVSGADAPRGAGPRAALTRTRGGVSAGAGFLDCIPVAIAPRRPRCVARDGPRGTP